MSHTELIKKSYYNTETGLVGSEKLYHRLKDKGVTKAEIDEFMKKQQISQTMKQKHFTGSFIPPYPKYEYQVDLIYLENPHLNIAKYGLCCIDIFTIIFLFL